MVKNLPASAGNLKDVGLITRSGRSLGGGYGNPLQYSYLGNPMDRGAWRAKSMISEIKTTRRFGFTLTDVAAVRKMDTPGVTCSQGKQEMTQSLGTHLSIVI